MNKKIIAAFAILVLAVLVAGIPLALISEYDSGSDGVQTAGNSALPDEITLDYATWSYLSLVLRDQKILEDEFRDDNVKLTWVLTQGGNKTMEFLMSGSVDIGTGAGVAGIISYINGNPIRAIYVTHVHSGEILVRADSGINSLVDLKGRTIAATPTTNPYLFLLGVMHSVGLTKDDVNIVPLQHHDGLLALFRGDVDAWSGGDRMAAALATGNDADEIKSIFRGFEFITPCFLFSREEFHKKYPQAVTKILKAYDRARQWALDNPERYLEIVARENRIPPEMAKVMVDNNNYDINIPGEIRDSDRDSMYASEIVLNQIVRKGTDIRKKVDELLDRDIFRKP